MWNVHMEFEIEIPKQTEVMLRKTCPWELIKLRKHIFFILYNPKDNRFQDSGVKDMCVKFNAQIPTQT